LIHAFICCWIALVTFRSVVSHLTRTWQMSKGKIRILPNALTVT